jgi:hypothetical protein
MTYTKTKINEERTLKSETRVTAIYAVKVIVLTFLLLMIYALSATLSGLSDIGTSTDAMATMNGTLLMILSYTIVLSYPIIRSKWTGLKLILAIAAAYYGLAVFLPQLDVVLFLDYFESLFDVTMVPKILIQGAIVTVLFVPLCVFVFRKMRSDTTNEPSNERPRIMSKKQWAIKLGVIACSYIVLYVAAGALIAWQNPELAVYYGDLIDQMSAVGIWMLLFQGLRAIIFAAIAFPIIRLMKGKWWEKGFAVALLFSVLMSAAMLIPTSFMPDSVRMSHFLELFSENFILGWIVTWLLHRPHSSIRDLFAMRIYSRNESLEQGETKENEKQVPLLA